MSSFLGGVEKFFGQKWLSLSKHLPQRMPLLEPLVDILPKIVFFFCC